MTNPARVFYFSAPLVACRIGISMCEECERVDFANDEPRFCDVCHEEIAVGAEVAALTNVDEYTKLVAPDEYGDTHHLHRDCANAYTMDYDEYYENIHD